MLLLRPLLNTRTLPCALLGLNPPQARVPICATGGPAYTSASDRRCIGRRIGARLAGAKLERQTQK